MGTILNYLLPWVLRASFNYGEHWRMNSDRKLGCRVGSVISFLLCVSNCFKVQCNAQCIVAATNYPLDSLLRVPASQGYLLDFTSGAIKQWLLFFKKLSRMACYMTDMWFEFCYKHRTKGPRVFLCIIWAVWLWGNMRQFIIQMRIFFAFHFRFYFCISMTFQQASCLL